MTNRDKHITGLNSAMAYMERCRKSEESRTYKPWQWSAMNEYPILFSLIPTYAPTNVIEVGTNAGCSALMFAVAYECMGWEESKYNIYTWNIEEAKGVDEGTRFYKRIKRITESFSESKIADAIFKTLEGKTLFFIDGGHTEEECKKDFLKVIPILRKGDVVTFHDARAHQPIRDAIEAALAETNLAFSNRYLIPSSRGIEVIVV
jgi:predicted O-methyltransferase YrrM